VTSCGVVNMPQSSLANDEWILDGTPTARWLVGSSIPVKSGTDSGTDLTAHAACTLEVDEGACVVEIPLRRSPVAVVVGHLIPCLIIVFGGLGALWLDPTVPPLMGGRVGLMITAMLVVGNMSKSVQLRLTTVMWMDFFSMAQFLLLLCALLGTIMVHYNLRNGHKARAVAFDEALRICAWVAYLGVMASVFTYGTTHSNVVFSVTILVTVLLVLLLLFFLQRRILTMKHDRRVALLKQLEQADLDDPSGETLAQSIFDEFDDDRSGRLSISEAAAFIHLWFPSLSKKAAYQTARRHANDGSLGFGIFVEMLMTERESLREQSAAVKSGHARAGIQEVHVVESEEGEVSGPPCMNS